MRFYMNQLKHYCDIDLYARIKYMRVPGLAGATVSEQALRTRSDLLLKTIVLNQKAFALVMLYELEGVDQFPRVQNFPSSGRRVEWAKDSADRRYGTSGRRIGYAHPLWAFSEAAVPFLRKKPVG